MSAKLKALLMYGYCLGLLPAWIVTVLFRWFKLAEA